jgi:putative membrane protein
LCRCNTALAEILQGRGLAEARFFHDGPLSTMTTQRLSRLFFSLAGGFVMVPLALAHPGEAHDAAAQLSWNADPWIIAGVTVTSLLYVRGIHRLWGNSRRGAGVPVWRTACFAGGMATLVIALLSPVDTLSAKLFSMHMVQHELMMLVAAPLLVCGRPLAVFVWAFRPGGRKPIAHLVKSRAVQAPWQILTRPFAAWLLHAVILWAWHFPTLFQAGLTSDFVHAVQHASFLGSALLFWVSLIGPHWQMRAGAALIYILATAIHTGMLGALLTFSTRIWYPVYAQTAGAWGLSVLEDQQLGGLIMWVPAGFILLLAGLLVAANAIAPAWQGDRQAAGGSGN